MFMYFELDSVTETENSEWKFNITTHCITRNVKESFSGERQMIPDGNIYLHKEVVSIIKGNYMGKCERVFFLFNPLLKIINCLKIIRVSCVWL